MSPRTLVQIPMVAKSTFTPVAKGMLQRSTATTECDDCRKKREGMLQRSAITSAPVHDVPRIVHEVLRSPGQPLDVATQAFMEPRFGFDFSAVRVHTGTRAEESARSVNALAYTVGQHLVFGAGRYMPQSEEGKRLMAHELAHVVQQNGSSQPQLGESMSLSRESDPQEREAEQISREVTNLRDIKLSPASNTIVHVRKHPRPRGTDEPDRFSESASKQPAGIVSGSHNVLWRREAVIAPNPIEENPAVRMLNDESPGLTSPAINGYTIRTGQDFQAAMPEPRYVARPAPGGRGYECRVAAAVDMISGTDMIVTTSPSAEGWRAEATPGWLAENGEILCLIRDRSVPLLMRHESDNQIFYNRVRHSEGEHHADVAELHRRILKPYHDRVAMAVSTPRIGPNAQACTESLARHINWLGTIQQYANDWAVAEQRRDGPGGTHNTEATLATSDYCVDATLTLHGN